MRVTSWLLRVEDHLLRGQTALSLLVERESQEHDDLGDETPAAAAQGGPMGQ